jgi:hypothetical protein
MTVVAVKMRAAAPVAFVSILPATLMIITPIAVAPATRPIFGRAAGIAVVEMLMPPFVVAAILDAAAVVRTGPIEGSFTIEIVTAAAGAQHASRACVGVEPNDTPVRRHPFQAIVHLTVGTLEWTFGIVESARMSAANLRKNAIQWQQLRVENVALPPVVVVLRVGGGDGERSEKEAESPYEHAVTHGRF